MQYHNTKVYLFGAACFYFMVKYNNHIRYMFDIIIIIRTQKKLFHKHMKTNTLENRLIVVTDNLLDIKYLFKYEPI